MRILRGMAGNVEACLQGAVGFGEAGGRKATPYFHGSECVGADP